MFVIKKELHDTLDQASLAYLPLQLLTLQPEDVAAVRIQKEGQEEYRLTHETCHKTGELPSKAFMIGDRKTILTKHSASCAAGP